MAKKIIRGGKIYIDSSLLKTSKPTSVKDTRGLERAYYELDLTNANASGGGDSIYTADGTITDFERTIDLETGNKIILEYDYSVYSKSLLELKNVGNQAVSLAMTEYDGASYQRGTSYSSSGISNSGSGGAGTSGDDEVFTIVSNYTGTNAGVRLESYAGSSLKTLKVGANGATYGADYSASFIDRSLPDKAYVDSYTGQIKRAVVNIGDWNMDAADTAIVAHGLTFGNIRNIEGVIRNDAANTAYASGTIDSSGNIQWTVVSYDATNITLRRRPAAGGGIFDSTDFDSTSFNRGWLIIDYVD